MAIVHEAVSTAGANATTVTCNKPTGTVSGDVLVAVWGARVNVSDANMTLPSGWTQVAYANPGNTTPSFKVAYKVAGASEPASYDFTLSTAGNHAVVISRYSGVDNTTPSDVAASTNSDNSGTSTTLTYTGITTSTNGAMLVAGATASALALTITGPSDMTEAAETSANARVEEDYLIIATAGATGNKTGSLSSGARWCTVLWALRPASGSAATSLPIQRRRNTLVRM